MRTTLTLDEDVAAKLRQEMRRSGRSFKETVNDFLRRGLNGPGKKATKRFVVRARDLGELRPGLSLDNIEELLDQVDGPFRR